MKITSLKAVAVRIPVKRPTRISTRVLDKRDYVLVWVGREDSELEGIGYIYAGTSGGAMVAEAVNGILAPLLVGRPPTTSSARGTRCIRKPSSTDAAVR